MKKNATHARHNQQGVTYQSELLSATCMRILWSKGEGKEDGGSGEVGGGEVGGKEGSSYLRRENRQGYKATKEAHRHPVGGHLPDPKVAKYEVQLAVQGQAAGPDVYCCLAPQLHRPTCPPVLLLAVRKEAGWQLN